MVQATWRFIPVVLCFPEYSFLCPAHDQHGSSVPSRMYWASGSRSSAVGTNSRTDSGMSGVIADMARVTGGGEGGGGGGGWGWVGLWGMWVGVGGGGLG